jgi:hypothetical protein
VSLGPLFVRRGLAMLQFPLMARAAPVVTRAGAAMAVTFGFAACSSGSQPPSSTASASAGASQCAVAGAYCVDIDVTGTLAGHLTAAAAPSGFAVVCRALTRPHNAWVSHVYTMLDGKLWHLVVETTAYAGAGSYNALLTFSLAQAATGTPPPAAESYSGQGKAVVASGGAAATVTGSLRTADAVHTITVKGGLSCQSAS